MTQAVARVVALGGGHGLAAALRAVRRYASSVTAVVSVADDGGSSGRLRRDLGIPPPGDLRKCLVALADEGSVWASVLEHRFNGGELDGHALGNLMIAGLTATLGDFHRAVEEVAALLGVEGAVVPATTEPVVLKAEVDGVPVEGQVAVSRSTGRIGRVEIVPADARAHGQAVQAIAEADQIVLAPGSLFTSLLPVVCVSEIREAIGRATGRVIQVCNLRPQRPETDGLDGAAHLRAALDHGLPRVDVFVYDSGGGLDVDEEAVRALGAEPVAASVADDRGLVHHPERLASVLGCLLAP